MAVGTGYPQVNAYPQSTTGVQGATPIGAPGVPVAMGVTLPAVQSAFDAGTPTQQAQFQSSVSGGNTLQGKLAFVKPLGIATDNSGALTLEFPILSPLEIPNCEVWYDASEGPVTSAWAVPADGGTAATWVDNSGNGRHATLASGSGQHGLSSGLGGKPGVSGRWVTPGFLTSGMGASGYTFIIVTKSPAGGHTGLKAKMYTTGADVHLNQNSAARDLTIAGLTGFSNNATPTPRQDGIDIFAASPTQVRTWTGDCGAGSGGSNATMLWTVSALATAWSSSQIYFGGAAIGGYDWPGTVSAFMMFSRYLTDTELRRLYAYLNSRYDPLPVLYCLGNSLSSGTGTTLGAGQSLLTTGTNLPSLLFASLGSVCRVVSDAIPGRTTTQLIADSPAYSGLTNSPRSVSLVWEGTNELNITGSPWRAYEQIVRLCRMRAGAGRRVAVGTVLYRNDTGNNPKNRALTDALNSLIRANWASFSDGICDFAADSRLQDPANTTYFAVDAVHTKEAGVQVEHDIARPVLLSLLQQV